jgi:hypothetical protein
MPANNRNHSGNEMSIKTDYVEQSETHKAPKHNKKKKKDENYFWTIIIAPAKTKKLE